MGARTTGPPHAHGVLLSARLRAFDLKGPQKWAQGAPTRAAAALRSSVNTQLSGSGVLPPEDGPHTWDAIDGRLEEDQVLELPSIAQKPAVKVPTVSQPAPALW